MFGRHTHTPHLLHHFCFLTSSSLTLIRSPHFSNLKPITPIVLPPSVNLFSRLISVPYPFVPFFDFPTEQRRVRRRATAVEVKFRPFLHFSSYTSCWCWFLIVSSSLLVSFRPTTAMAFSGELFWDLQPQVQLCWWAFSSNLTFICDFRWDLRESEIGFGFSWPRNWIKTF